MVRGPAKGGWLAWKPMSKPHWLDNRAWCFLGSGRQVMHIFWRMLDSLARNWRVLTPARMTRTRRPPHVHRRRWSDLRLHSSRILPRQYKSLACVCIPDI